MQKHTLQRPALLVSDSAFKDLHLQHAIYCSQTVSEGFYSTSEPLVHKIHTISNEISHYASAGH